jgi:hypothetical protein
LIGTREWVILSCADRESPRYQNFPNSGTFWV